MEYCGEDVKLPIPLYDLQNTITHYRESPEGLCLRQKFIDDGMFDLRHQIPMVMFSVNLMQFLLKGEANELQA